MFAILVDNGLIITSVNNTDSVPNSDEDEQRHSQQPTESLAETPQSKRDTATDVKEELCDLSAYNSVPD